jgi:hypothetical protein
MKDKVKEGLISLLIVGSAAFLATGCGDLFSGKDGYISLNFDRESVSQVMTKGVVSVPDTADFYLSITNSAGVSVYDGSYSERPEELAVPSGTYTVDVVSRVFTAAAFDIPVYGDSKTVVVTAGEHVSVSLECTMANCGLKLQFSERFKKKFADYILSLTDGKTSLEYGVAESRTAYFLPGEVTFNAKSGLTSVDVFKRTLAAGKVLTVKLDATSTETTGTPLFRIYVDTSAVYVSETVTYDGGSGGADGTSKATAYSITQAKQHAGEKVWVHGYIVGGDISRSGVVTFSGTFTAQSNIAIAATSSESVSAQCMSVELVSGGKAREALNLVSNPGNLGKEVWVCGTVAASYLGLIGVKGVSTDYSL